MDWREPRVGEREIALWLFGRLDMRRENRRQASHIGNAGDTKATEQQFFEGWEKVIVLRSLG